MGLGCDYFVAWVVRSWEGFRVAGAGSFTGTGTVVVVIPWLGFIVLDTPDG